MVQQIIRRIKMSQLKKMSRQHASKIAVIDIERENRLSKVISLYSKGLNQEEIAQELM